MLILDDFMPAAWADALPAWGIRHFAEFQHGTMRPLEEADALVRAYQDHWDLKAFQEHSHARPFLEALTPLIERGRDACELPPFELDGFEATVAVRGEGQAFHWHTDHISYGGPEVRAMTFAFFVHTRPRRWSGGELEFLGGELVEPRHNRLVLFDPYRVHRVRHVHFLPPLGHGTEARQRWERGEPEDWAHARWSVAGWFRCRPEEAWETPRELPPDFVHPSLVRALEAAGEFFEV